VQNYIKNLNYTNLIVKKYFLYGILSVLGLISVSQALYAGQYYKPKTNRLGVWTDLGADVWLMNGGELKTSFGGGAGVGMLYEFQQGNFLLNLGLGTNVLYNPVKASGVTIPLSNQDDWDPLYGPTGEKVDYFYNITTREDKYLSMNVQIPIMLGFRSDRFFMLVGAKFGYMFNLQTWCNSTIETTGYNHTIGWLRNMPMYQYYPEREKSETMRCTFQPDVAVSLELGGYVGEQVLGTGYNRFRKSRTMRVSAFVDYGLLTVNKPGTTAPIIAPDKYVPPTVYDMVDATSMKDVISSNIAGKMSNLFIGVKFTALFNLPEPPTCVMCNSEKKFVPRRTKTRM